MPVSLTCTSSSIYCNYYEIKGFRNCNKSNDGNPGRKGDKSAIQNNSRFKFYNDGFIFTVIVSNKNKQTEKNMPCIAVFHKLT